MKIYRSPTSGELDFETFPKRVARVAGWSPKGGICYKIDVERVEVEPGRYELYASHKGLNILVETDDVIVGQTPTGEYIAIHHVKDAVLNNPLEGLIHMWLPSRTRVQAPRITYLKQEAKRKLNNSLQAQDPDQTRKDLETVLE
jgi:hypothetical protein